MSQPGRLVIVAGPDTLGRTSRHLARRGFHVARLPLLAFKPIEGATLRAAVRRFGRADAVAFTSKEAVSAALRAHLFGEWAAQGRQPRLVVSGPTTARTLVRARIRPARSLARGGSAVLVSYFRTLRPARVIYLRSDRAGPSTAQVLRAAGHDVLDLTVYRTRPGSVARAFAAKVLRRADRLLVTSPSGLSALRALLGPRSFRATQRSVPLLVLGTRTARAARGHGFRRVVVAPGLSDEVIQRFLLRELNRGR